jgi:hypothetical protein
LQSLKREFEQQQLREQPQKQLTMISSTPNTVRNDEAEKKQDRKDRKDRRKRRWARGIAGAVGATATALGGGLLGKAAIVGYAVVEGAIHLDKRAKRT